MTLDELRQEATARVADARKSLHLLNEMEARYGAPLTSIDALSSESSQQEQLSEISGEGVLHLKPVFSNAGRPSTPSIRPDSYLGEMPLDAAKQYLGQIGHAVHIDQIADAVKKGGAATTGANWKAALEQSLLRSVHDVIKVQDKTFGLIRFYSDEQIKRLRQTRRQTPTPAGQKKRKRGRPKKNETIAPSGPKLLAGPAGNSDGSEHESN